nr:helix-turn-helix transcriptional regulator [Anaerocolumna sp.]
MRINEVIRKYRKAANLTQEQVANYLGVTAPAVNKWENGISMQDKERSLEAMEKLVWEIDSIEKAARSDLYKHMKMKVSSNMGEVKKMIKRGLESDEEVDFLREEPRFKSIIGLLK